MTCLEFRRRVGAEPFAGGADIEAHRRACAACARHQDELRAMDGVIRRALDVDLATPEAAPADPARASRRRAFAIAASLVAGAAIGFALLVAVPRDSVAREVVFHVVHESGAMDGTAPIPAAEVAAVLGPDGPRLRPGAGDVTYVRRCDFAGHVVPHLVVRTSRGPVTVLLLGHREVGEPKRFDELGYQGIVLPAPRGSIAVIGAGVADLEGVARKVYEAVEWGR
ncbi:MAG TPA: DUF3379 family protein [Steroidobacteraceae bacterium]|nr:DUF3379 family protein [Steroidobacteraceae bacterium]